MENNSLRGFLCGYIYLILTCKVMKNQSQCLDSVHDLCVWVMTVQCRHWCTICTTGSSHPLVNSVPIDYSLQSISLISTRGAKGAFSFNVVLCSGDYCRVQRSDNILGHLSLGLYYSWQGRI